MALLALLATGHTDPIFLAPAFTKAPLPARDAGTLAPATSAWPAVAAVLAIAAVVVLGTLVVVQRFRVPSGRAVDDGAGDGSSRCTGSAGASVVTRSGTSTV